MDSPTSNNSLRRWQTALAVFCQAVSSVATVRLTWTKTWLLPKLRAEGRLPKLFQLATPATGWWMPAEERTGHPCYRVMNASWRTNWSPLLQGDECQLKNEECACQKEVIRNWTGSSDRDHDRSDTAQSAFWLTFEPQTPGPTIPSHFAKCRHLTHSHVRQVFITDCRKPEVVPRGWQRTV